MAGGFAASLSSVARTDVRIVVAGDRSTGKSILIVTMATQTFPENVTHVLPPTSVLTDFYHDHCLPLTIIDTSARNASSQIRDKVVAELKKADVVMLAYACDQPATLDRLSTFWLPELRRLEVKVPVIVVGCKRDLRDEHQLVNLEPMMHSIMRQFLEIETCIECSAFSQFQVVEVFYKAYRAVVFPISPLYDYETGTLKPRFTSALNRIFVLSDRDRDGALSDAELNELQVKCFNAPLEPSEIMYLKRAVQEKVPEEVNDRGFTSTGFLFLHLHF